MRAESTTNRRSRSVAKSNGFHRGLVQLAPQEGGSTGQALSCRLKDGVGTVSHGREINGTARGMKAVMDVGDHTGAGRRECSLHAGGSWDLGGSCQQRLAWPRAESRTTGTPQGAVHGRTYTASDTGSIKACHSGLSGTDTNFSFKRATRDAAGVKKTHINCVVDC